MKRRLYLVFFMALLLSVPSSGCCQASNKKATDQEVDRKLEEKSRDRRRADRDIERARRHKHFVSPAHPGWILKGYNSRGGKILVRDPNFDRDGKPREKK